MSCILLWQLLIGRMSRDFTEHKEILNCISSPEMYVNVFILARFTVAHVHFLVIPESISCWMMQSPWIKNANVILGIVIAVVISVSLLCPFLFLFLDEYLKL